MIAIRFQIFFWNTSEERPNKLVAIRPMFASPGSVETLLKTAKYEKREPLIISGDVEKMEQLLSQVERSDGTDWLSLESWEDIKQRILKMAKSLGLSEFSPNIKEDAQVLGKSNVPKYPPDLPEGSYELWDRVKKQYKKQIQQGTTEDEKRAIQSIIYENAARKAGKIPWAAVTVKQIEDNWNRLTVELVRGEDKAIAIAEKFERHLISEQILKKGKAAKYFGAQYDHETSKYLISHEIEWTLTPDATWKSLFDYLVKKEAFKAHGPRMLTLDIDRLTYLEIVPGHDDKAFLYIVHRLTPNQAAILGKERENEAILKSLNNIAKLWYKSGKFPRFEDI